MYFLKIQTGKGRTLEKGKAGKLMPVNLSVPGSGLGVSGPPETNIIVLQGPERCLPGHATTLT